MAEKQETQYYRTVPVSEKPKKDGAYLMIFADGLFSNNCYYFKDGQWAHPPDLRGFTHYLQPIPMPDAERLREALEKIAVEPFSSDCRAIAREALSAVGDGWVRVEEKQPELNEVIWLGWSSAHVTTGRLVEGKPWLQEEPIYISNENGHAFVPQPTHWKPYTVPLPPQPIKQKP